MSRSDFIIDREAYQPQGPLFGEAYRTAEPAPDPFGLFQLDGTLDASIGQLFLHYAETEPSFDIDLDLYQQWCEYNWKQPHGTIWSQERLGKKLVEEYEEALLEIENGDQPKAEDELGDLLWCATATTSNLGRNIKHAMMIRLTDYGHGKRYANGTTPQWVRAAQEIVFEPANFTALGVDELMEKGFLPEPSAISYVDEIDGITQPEIKDMLTHLYHSIHSLRMAAERNYETDRYQVGSVGRVEVIESSIAEVYLIVAFLARHCASTSLAEIIRKNIIKLSMRVGSNTIDKSDGPRE